MGALKWFQKYGAFVVSVSSLAVAVASLLFTVQAQKYDRDYKELSIRPRLQWSTSGMDLSVNLDNVGMGMATIVYFSMRIDNKCVQTNLREGLEMETKMRGALERALTGALGEEIMNSKVPHSFYIHTRTYIPGYRETVPVSKIIKILSVTEESMAEISRIAEFDLGKDRLREMYNRFFKTMRDIGLTVRYCSVTGRFCETNSLGEGGCVY